MAKAALAEYAVALVPAPGDVRIPPLEDAIARSRDTRGDNFQTTIGDRTISKGADAVGEPAHRAIRHSVTQTGTEVTGNLPATISIPSRHVGSGGGVQIQHSRGKTRHRKCRGRGLG